MADYRPVAQQAAARYGIDPNVFSRQIQQESGFNPSARSPVGATGIAQIMPATARAWGVNPNDPVASLDAAARNMARYLKAYGGSWENALEAYNAGPGNVNLKGPPKYAETQKYVRNILGGLGQQQSAPVPMMPGQQYPVSPPGSVPGGWDHNRLQPLLVQAHRDAMNGRLNRDQFLKQIQSARLPDVQTPGTYGVTPPTPLPTQGGASMLLGNPLDRPGAATQPGILGFAEQIARALGKPIKLGTGTAHNQYVLGTRRQSAHWEGNALDLPATGPELIALGQAALIAAGMPAALARKQRGGVFNVNGHNILFNTRVGGNHENHLHVGQRG